jgi:hypothetical protein
LTPSVDVAADDERARALDAFLAEREGDGYRVESRSRLQAVISRRPRLPLALRWLARNNAQQRLVVSVDQHGVVTSAAAEPVRW